MAQKYCSSCGSPISEDQGRSCALCYGWDVDCGSMNKYKTIVIDPPWKYGKWGKASCPAYNGHIPKDSDLPYKWMSIDEIKKLPVSTLADDNCELYLWATQKYLPTAFDVIRVWGFKYCQTLTWCKKPMGKGQGGVYCPTTEFLILARRGKMPTVKRIDTTWWEIKRFYSAGRNHSKKPEFFQDLIEQVSESPRLEMFARRKRENWDVWGNEVDSDITIPVR